MLALACAASCGPTGPIDGDGSAGSSGTRGTGSTGPGATGPVGSSTQGADTTAGSGSTESGTTSDCVGACFVDFPCNGSERGCVDPTTIEVWESVSVDDCSQTFGCEDACFCKGSTCEPRDPEPCPPDTWCVEQGEDGQPTAECLPASEVCGGPEGLTCPVASGQLCEYAMGLCPACLEDPGGCGPGSELGWCVPRPAPEDDCGPAIPGEEQCGCDGMTYANECERLRAGAALADDGPCP